MSYTNALFSQIVNPKGEMKGSAITGPVGKEAAELWPVSDSGFAMLQHHVSRSMSSPLRLYTDVQSLAYRIQLWCCDVKGRFYGVLEWKSNKWKGLHSAIFDCMVH